MERGRILVMGLAVALLLLVGCGQRSALSHESYVDHDAQGSVDTGKKAPDFALRTSDGDTFSLKALKGKRIAVVGVGNPFG